MDKFSDEDILKLYEMLNISNIGNHTRNDRFPVTPYIDEVGWSITITNNSEGENTKNG